MSEEAVLAEAKAVIDGAWEPIDDFHEFWVAVILARHLRDQGRDVVIYDRGKAPRFAVTDADRLPPGMTAIGDW